MVMKAMVIIIILLTKRTPGSFLLVICESHDENAPCAANGGARYAGSTRAWRVKVVVVTRTTMPSHSRRSIMSDQVGQQSKQAQGDIETACAASGAK